MTGNGLRKMKNDIEDEDTLDNETEYEFIDENDNIIYEDKNLSSEMMLSIGKTEIVEVGRIIANPNFVKFAGRRYLTFDIDLIPRFRKFGGQYDKWYLEGSANTAATAFFRLNYGYTVAVWGRRRSVVARDRVTKRPRSFNFNEVIRIDVLSEDQEGGAGRWKQEIRNIDSIGRHR